MERDQLITTADSFLCQHRALLSPAEDAEYLRLLREEREKPDTDEEGNETPVSLDLVKAYKVLQLLVYDASTEVNGFSIGGQLMWLSPEERANYLLTIEAAQEAGIESVPFAGVTLPVAIALAALKAIDLYAYQCVVTRDTHKAAINALTSIEAVDEYDFKRGYPEKLNF